VAALDVELMIEMHGRFTAAAAASSAAVGQMIRSESGDVVCLRAIREPQLDPPEHSTYRAIEPSGSSPRDK
jgi:hypothetical protein